MKLYKIQLDIVQDYKSRKRYSKPVTSAKLISAYRTSSPNCVHELLSALLSHVM